MSIGTPTALSDLHRIGVDHLRQRWGWFLGMGILLVVLGTVAIGASAYVTLATMYLLGWLMIFGGAMEAGHAFTSRAWGGFFLDLLVGLLYAVTGLLIVAKPVRAAETVTFLIALMLTFGGIFHIAAAVAIRFQHATWLLLHGVINVALGIMIWQDWPVSGLWVIGLFIGIDMIMNGWSLVMLGLAAKSLPAGG